MSSSTPQELLEAIYEDPDDGQRRAVYADLLSEQEDPRGELITLQLQREELPLSRKLRDRERELLDTHGRRWLGDIAPCLSKEGLEYRRGFPARGRVELTYGEPVSAHLMANPAWSTFESLTFADSRISKEFARHAPLRCLRELQGADVALVSQLAGKDSALSRRLLILRIAGCYDGLFGWIRQFAGDSIEWQRMLRELGHGPGLTNLETLWFFIDNRNDPPSLQILQWLLESPRAAQLSCLRLDIASQVSTWLRLFITHASELPFRELQLRSDNRNPAGSWPRTFEPQSRQLSIDLRDVPPAQLTRALADSATCLEFLALHRCDVRALRLELEADAKPNARLVQRLHAVADNLPLERRELPHLV